MPPSPKKPYVPKDLLTWLEETFRDKAPSRDDSNRMVWIQAGQVEVVRALRRLYELQEKV